MLTPTSSGQGAGRSRWHRLWGAVTSLAGAAAVAGLLGLQAPAASAGVAQTAAPGHAATAGHALAASVAEAIAHPQSGTAAAKAGPAARLKPVVRTAVRHDLSAPLRK